MPSDASDPAPSAPPEPTKPKPLGAGRPSIAAVRLALAAGRFHPAYQPIVRASDGRLVGFEALARWRCPVRGTLTPGAFHEALADPATAGRISDRMLDQSLEDAQIFRDAGFNGRIAVNLSEAQLQRPHFARDAIAAAASAEIPTDALSMEITEVIALARDPKKIAHEITELREAGIAVAFDDFGTGHATLTHLRDIEVDRIKIDRSFIREIESEPRTRAIVRSLVRLGADMGMEVVAEGVETRAARDILNEMGETLIQGYLYSRPVFLEEAVVLARLRALSPQSG